MTKDEAMKLALEALENVQYYGWGQTERDYDARTAAITALRKALAEQPAQQEPVAWNVVDPTGKIVATEKNAIRGWARLEGYKPTVEGLLGFHEQGWRVVPTTPPAAQRQWVGLTNEEMKHMLELFVIPPHHVEMVVQAIEAKLKEKNT